MAKCELCGKDAELREYKIIDDMGTRHRNICPECAQNLENKETLVKQRPDAPGREGAAQNSPAKTIVNRTEKSAQVYSVILFVIGAAFLTAALILYAVSVSNDYGVANIQSTVFAAANFIAAIVCFTGGTVIKALKK